jgi:hypothetical protein
MKKHLGIVMAMVVCFSPLAPGAGAQEQEQGVQGMPPAKAHQAPGAPAPKRDISGVWSGAVVPRLEPVAPMTPWGQAIFDQTRPFAGRGARTVEVGVSNDPMRTCDPLGFPRNVLWETRNLEFDPTPSKMIELFQYQRVWREIWTDGQPLPTDVGGSAPNSPDPRFYGYSIGHWADDYTFVVETTGLDERTWLDANGHPHSVGAHVEERYTRVDHDTLELTVTIDDPKAYTKPFEIMKQDFKLNPKPQEEQMCVPSEAEDYMKLIAAPAVKTDQK